MSIYEKCWDILVQHAGADPETREHFLQYARECTDYMEFRFCGVLGFGGKFWYYRQQLYVTCYPEDETPEHREVIAKVNTLLSEVSHEAAQASSS